MSLDLVVARCGRSPLLMGDTHALPEPDREALLDPTSMDGSCALAMVLPSGRFAVGRRDGARCAWWVGDAFPVDPPHALWIERGLFTADGEATVPTALDPAHLLPALGRLVTVARAAKVVAATVRLLRASDTPVCIVANGSPEGLEALALTIVAVCGGGLSVAVGHPEPDPARYRLAVSGSVLDGYEPVMAADPPDEGDDLVAWFARDRLGTDPAALFVPGGVTEDHVRQVLQAGALAPASSREGRVRVLVARLRAGAFLDDALLAELLAVTEISADARPWLALRRRPSDERGRAVAAALRRSARLKPTASLLDAFSAVYPRGAPLAPWCAALLDWIRRASVPGPFIAALERSLEAWPQAATRANRASVWTELVQILVDRGEPRMAERAITGPVVEKLAREGSGVAIANMWGILPDDRRNPRKLGAIVEQLARHPEGDVAAAALYRHVHHNAAETDILLKSWLRMRGSRAVDADDALFAALDDPDHVARWLELAFDLHPPGPVLLLIPRVASGPEDPLWLEAETALARRTEESARFLNLAQLHGGLVALEPLARGLIGPALAVTRFPHGGVAETARRLVLVAGSARMWPWIAVAAAHPGRFTDDEVDGTVVDMCAAPPGSESERAICVSAAEALGAAHDWEPLDHARWIVRLLLAPADAEGFRDALLAGLMRGLGSREDAQARLADITHQLLQLGPEHEALVGFLDRCLGTVWPGGVPEDFVWAVEARGVPDASRPVWARRGR